MFGKGISAGTLQVEQCRDEVVDLHGLAGDATRLRRSVSLAALVVIIHAGAIYVFLLTARSYGTTADGERRSTLIFVVEQKPRTENPDRHAERSREDRAIQQARDKVEPISVTSEPETAIRVDANPSIDWQAAAEEAAKNSVAQANAGPKFRSLDSKPKIEHPPKLDLPHVRGDTQRLANGELITWIDSECYATNRDLADPSMGANAVNLVCKGNVGKRKADGTLFQSLRPKYLELPTPPVTNEEKSSEDNRNRR